MKKNKLVWSHPKNKNSKRNKREANSRNVCLGQINRFCKFVVKQAQLGWSDVPEPAFFAIDVSTNISDPKFTAVSFVPSLFMFIGY